MDIDLLGRLNNSIDTIIGITKGVCTQDVEPDGMVFDMQSVRGEHITEDADYEGVRVKFSGLLDTAQIRMQLDTLFPTLPISWKGTLAQYTGRLHRFHDMKKEVIIYDHAGLNVPMLAKMYTKRLHGYKAIGYEVKE